MAALIRTAFTTLMLIASTAQADICVLDYRVCEQRADISATLDQLFAEVDSGEVTTDLVERLAQAQQKAGRIASDLQLLGGDRAFTHHYIERSAHILAEAEQFVEEQTLAEQAQPVNATSAVADITLWVQ